MYKNEIESFLLHTKLKQKVKLLNFAKKIQENMTRVGKTSLNKL